MTVQSGQERRRFKRVQCNEAVKLRIGEINQSVMARVCDISEGGLKIGLDTPIPAKAKLMINIQIQGDRMFECTGHVVWIRKALINNSYEAGIEFEGCEVLIPEGERLFSSVGKDESGLTSIVVGLKGHFAAVVKKIGNMSYIILTPENIAI